MKNILLTVCSFIFFCSVALAREVKVATITSDIDYDVTDFFLEIKDNGELDSMRFVTKRSNGSIAKDETHPAERVIQDGIVLNENGNYKVIVLRVEKTFSVTTGGIVTLDYLYNGATGSRRSYKIKLERIGTGNFSLREIPSNDLIKGFFIYGNRTIFGLVGVKYIEAIGE
jgi:hypothetical protein